MRRALGFAVLALWGCDPGPADFSGRWLMHETDPACEHRYSRCWLEVEQTGDRVRIRSTAEGGEWTCEGRGEVEGNRMRFRWAGPRPEWRGSAEVERVGDELRGTYVREVEGTGVQHCRGSRAR